MKSINVQLEKDDTGSLSLHLNESTLQTLGIKDSDYLTLKVKKIREKKSPQSLKLALPFTEYELLNGMNSSEHPISEDFFSNEFPSYE